jgi:DNA-binding response OmpR family regulator
MNRVLVVEDEPVIAMGLEDSLRAEGYEVEIARDGPEGESLALAGSFDAILLDVMLPRRDGFTVCRNLRASGLKTPVIMLTARGQESDKIRGLDTGADDYVTKPFSRGELMARLRAALRRGAEPAERACDSFEFGCISVDFTRHEARRRGEPLELTPIEFKLLKAFVAHRGRVLPHDEIIERVWGRDAFLSDRVLYTHVNNLRSKIEEVPSSPRFLHGVRGVGYRFDG